MPIYTAYLFRHHRKGTESGSTGSCLFNALQGRIFFHIHRQRGLQFGMTFQMKSNHGKQIRRLYCTKEKEKRTDQAHRRLKENWFCCYTLAVDKTIAYRSKWRPNALYSRLKVITEQVFNTHNAAFFGAHIFSTVHALRKYLSNSPFCLMLTSQYKLKSKLIFPGYHCPIIARAQFLAQ